jgi:hypothetical protein
MKKVVAKKLDTSAVISNLAIVCAVVVVSLPLLLGNQLGEIASKVANEGASLIQELGDSFLGLFT